MEEELSLGQFRSMLDNAIRSEITRARPPAPFSIDFKKVPLAEAANRRAAYDETIALLGSWPGPLSMFVRTPQGQGLGVNERSKLMRGLVALGEAFLRTGQGEWAEDVVRLGIQFGQDLAASAPLFALLGQARLETERYGEAIGLFRRAASLGGHQPEVMLPLARCFFERGRYVAAMACLDEAEMMGARGSDVPVLREQIRAVLGHAYDRYRSLL
jgi:tetratricopeptide (TPR) repeat protein